MMWRSIEQKKRIILCILVYNFCFSNNFCCFCVYIYFVFVLFSRFTSSKEMMMMKRRRREKAMRRRRMEFTFGFLCASSFFRLHGVDFCWIHTQTYTIFFIFLKSTLFLLQLTLIYTVLFQLFFKELLYLIYYIYL